MHAGIISCVVGDDHEAIRRGVVEYLKYADGVEVIGEAGDGERLLDLVTRRLPAAVVADVHMRGLDGVEVCRQIRSRQLPTKVVLYTGDDDAGLLEQGLEAGASAFVVKSGSMGDLARALGMAVRGETYIDPSLVTALLARRDASAAGRLSAREMQVIERVADGMTTQEIGSELFLSPATIRSYMEGAIHKLGARNRPHAVAKALRDGLIA